MPENNRHSAIAASTSTDIARRQGCEAGLGERRSPSGLLRLRITQATHSLMQCLMARRAEEFSFRPEASRLPVLKNLMPAALSLIEDAVSPITKDNRNTYQDVARRVININLMVLVALGCAIGYYLNGYIAFSSVIYEMSMLAGIALGFIAAARMKTTHFMALLAISGLAGIVVEFVNTHSSPDPTITPNMLAYNYSESIMSGSPLSLESSFIYIAFGWMVIMLAILQASDLLCGWITNLGIFSRLRGWRVTPLAIILVVFGLFFFWEGYFGLA